MSNDATAQENYFSFDLYPHIDENITFFVSHMHLRAQ